MNEEIASNLFAEILEKISGKHLSIPSHEKIYQTQLSLCNNIEISLICMPSVDENQIINILSELYDNYNIILISSEDDNEKCYGYQSGWYRQFTKHVVSLE